MKKILLAFMVLTTILVATPQPAQSFSGGSFLITCRFSKFGAFDPLTNASSHEHTFSGNTGVSINSTKSSLLKDGTNCSSPRDHSAYWIPTFTKNGMKLQPYQVNIYYIARGKDRVAFPDGYKVKSTDVRYACSNDSSGNKVPYKCPGSGTAQYNVTFFSDKYPEVHMMFKFNVNSLVGATASSDMMGDPRHGDMFPAFESGVLENLIKTCLNTGKTCGRINN